MLYFWGGDDTRILVMMHPDHSDHLTTLTTPTTRLPRPPRPLRPPTYTTPMYLCKVYFCEMYPTCVSCKLCEFIFWDTLYILCFHKNFPLRRGQKHAKRALRLARDNTGLDGQNQSALKRILRELQLQRPSSLREMVCSAARSVE